MRPSSNTFVHRAMNHKVFATQNTSDFVTPTIEDELAAHNCKLFGSFESADRYIRSMLWRP